MSTAAGDDDIATSTMFELFARYVAPHFTRRDDQLFRTELADDALGGG